MLEQKNGSDPLTLVNHHKVGCTAVVTWLFSIVVPTRVPVFLKLPKPQTFGAKSENI